MPRNFCIWMSSLLIAYSSQAAVINGTAAKVGSTLITVRDAQFFYALSSFKAGKGQPLKKPTQAEVKKTVQKMIFEEMVFAEAKNFKFQGVSKGAAQKLINRRKSNGKKAVWNKLLARYGKSEAFALARVQKSLSVERFVQRKVETLTPIITDVEVERYHRQNKARFNNQSLSKIKPTIVLMLKKQRVEAGLEEWIRFLKKKYEVANYLEG